MKNLKRILYTVLIISALFSLVIITQAESTINVNLTIRDGNNIIYSNSVPLQPAGTINLNDSSGNSHPIDANSVLSVLNDANILSSDFNISDLQYYDSFGSFYLKCITDSIGNQCDNWQYTVNDSYSSLGMDKIILNGGENIYLYFGPQHKIILSSNSITSDEVLTVTTQDYDYQNDSWEERSGVTVGLTQPDPNNPWSPIEVQTNSVNSEGKAEFSSISAGSYDVGVKEDYYFPTEKLNVTTPPEPVHHSSSSGSMKILKNPFDTKKALDFLSSQQKANGSFGEELYTDWATLAFASNPDYLDQKTKLIKYFSENKFSSELLTDYERYSMALMSLNLNPYNFNGENYIKKITDSFDGKQFGDVEKDNDDIFALIVLQNVGYTKSDKMISETINFILSKQKANGSWDENIDMTSAAIEALSFFKGKDSLPTSPLTGGEVIQIESKSLSEAINKAREFLKENQKNDGSFGNISSTTWAMQGILALGEKLEDWGKENTPNDYLGLNQDIDGGMKNQDTNSKIWETTYAVVSMSGKTWNQIMQKFEILPLTKDETKILTTEINPLSETIDNSNQKKFVKKIRKYTKPLSDNQFKNANMANSIDSETKNPIGISKENTKEPIKKQNFFRRILRAIFGF